MNLECPVTIQTITAQGYLFVESAQEARHVD
jgi:two-component system OmpR family response regulator/two-component system response regulator RstA